MGRSREKRSRGKIRRRRQLREESERIASRQQGGCAENEASSQLQFRKYKIELFLAAFVIICSVFIMSFGPDKKAAKKMRNSFDPFLYSQLFEWDSAFAQGYKVIVFTDEGIIQTSFDTLPKDLKINWKKMSVTRIQANQQSGIIEKIKITLDGITYAPAGISGLTTSVTLSRQKGASARLAKLGKLEFVAKIVEDEDHQLFCLLGLRSL